LDSTPFEESIDTGLLCLGMLSRLFGVPADPAQLRHQFGESGKPFASSEILRAAKSLGLKAREVESDWSKLLKTQLPAMAIHEDGHFFIIAQIKEDAEKEGQALIQDPLEQKPTAVTREELASKWSGKLILLTRRAGMLDGFKKFDFSWFIPAILKYKRLLSEVLIASFFIQLFALVTPLFFQVVIDKVLVHRGLTTLDVLAMGLLVVYIFDVVLNGLRNYVFSHTTNRYHRYSGLVSR